MIASVPSRMALATSVTSARVGRGCSTIERSICVAVITGLAIAFVLEISIFCMRGTVSSGISTPRSPRATMMPSATFRISSMFASASNFSIFAISGTS